VLIWGTSLSYTRKNITLRLPEKRMLRKIFKCKRRGKENKKHILRSCIILPVLFSLKIFVMIEKTRINRRCT